MAKPFIALTGPTAVGKTALALDLAERLGAEIISVDSRQVYRGLDIGTATPSVAELARVPHHFIDELDPGDPYSAGRFSELAAQRIDEIVGRGRVPLAVGGSTLYLEALIHGIADSPVLPSTVRAAVEEEAQDESGRLDLFEELRQADPDAATTLDPTKSHRLIRMVGVLRASGKKPSDFWKAAVPPAYPFRVFVLDRPRPGLYGRIESRVDAMLAEGLVDENRRLLDAGVSPSSAPMRTIGYKEPLAYLRGEIDDAEMVRLLKRNTRRYAKRQLTWFRRRTENTWLDAATTTVDDVLSMMR